MAALKLQSGHECHTKNFKGMQFRKNVGGNMVLVLCTLSNGGLYCNKFRKISSTVLKLQSGHDFHTKNGGRTDRRMDEHSNKIFRGFNIGLILCYDKKYIT